MNNLCPKFNNLNEIVKIYKLSMFILKKDNLQNLISTLRIDYVVKHLATHKSTGCDDIIMKSTKHLRKK